MASKTSLSKAARLEVLQCLAEALEAHYETDALTVPSNETGDSYDLAIPMTDAENNDIWALVKVSIPRGTRDNGSYLPYDGYSLHEEYVERMERKTAEKEAKAKEKEKKKKKKVEEEEE